MTTDTAPPLEPRFCHQCGAAVTLRFVPQEQRDRLVCERCGFVHYLNPRVVASVIPERVDGSGARHVLLMRRAMEPRRGYWTPPGGFVELGESTEEAAVREGQEEVGMTMELAGLVGVYSRPAVGIVAVCYYGSPLEADATLGIEALETSWFAADAIPWDDLAFETTVRALRDWLALA